MSKKPKVKTEKDTSERWLLTYSDLMNLLLILFIILYSASRADAVQFQQIAESLRVGFSTISVSQTGTSNSSSSSQSPTDSNETNNESSTFFNAEMMENASGSDTSGGTGSAGSGTIDAQYEGFYNDLMKLLKQNNLMDSVSVTSGQKGIAISFADKVLFAKSSAVLNDSAYAIIDKIGSLLTRLPFSYILVEGHADSDKIHTQYYEDNMDLSSKRAANVWRRLVACGLQPKKMASVGYGEYRPVAPNDTVENKAKNRRVVITILKEGISTNSNATISGNSNTNNSAASPIH